MDTINGLRDILSALHVEALFRKGTPDMRKVKRKLTDDVNMTFQSAPCACTILTLFAYNEVNK